MKVLKWLGLAGVCMTGLSAVAYASTLVTPPPTAPPARIQVTSPLPKKPPAGKSVIALICQLPACSRYEAGVTSATRALHWSVKFETLSATAPATSLAEAVAQKPNYIFMSGVPVAAIKAPLAQAHAAHIPVISAADPEPASRTGYTAQIGGTLVPDAENVARWIIDDSSGKANMVAISIPQYPVLVGETNWLSRHFRSLCHGCKFNTLDVTVDEVGAGKVPSLITAYLQSHPGTNYVFFTFSDLGLGVAQPLKAAGFGSVKLTGCCGDSNDGKYVAAGIEQAWTIAPNQYSGYASVDAMARLSVGLKLTRSYLQAVWPSPSWVVSTAAAANKYLKAAGYNWAGPTGFEKQFQQLWHVG